MELYKKFKLQKYNQTVSHPFFLIPNLIERIHPTKIWKTPNECFIDKYNKAIEDLNSIYKLNSYLVDLPIKFFKKKFTLNELIILHIYTQYGYNSDNEKQFTSYPPINLVDKIKYSHLHYSSINKFKKTDLDYNDLVDIYYKLINFDLGLKDFSIQIDHSTFFNPKGKSRFNRIFLDGEIAYIIKYKNQNSIVVSFNIFYNEEGKLTLEIKQIQSLIKHNNRSLFKFPINYFEYIFKKFLEHFNEFEIRLVDGKFTADDILHLYENSYHNQKIYYEESLTSWNYYSKLYENDTNSEHISSLEYHKNDMEQNKINLEKCEISLNKFKTSDYKKIKQFYNQKLKYIKSIKKDKYRILFL